MTNNDANTMVTVANRSAARRAPKLALLTWLSCLSLLSANIPTLSADVIYRIEDKDGNVIFTDTPPPSQQAETIELSPTNRQPTLTRPKASSAPQAEENTSSTSYTSIKLVQPTNNLTIPPGQLDVVAQIALEPQLQKGHLVQFFMDGKAQGRPAATTSVSIGNLSRGAHRIRAQVTDQDKSVVARTGTVTIHVKRHSAKR